MRNVTAISIALLVAPILGAGPSVVFRSAPQPQQAKADPPLPADAPTDDQARAYKVAKLKALQAQLKAFNLQLSTLRDESLNKVKRDMMAEQKEKAVAAASTPADPNRIIDAMSIVERQKSGFRVSPADSAAYDAWSKAMPSPDNIGSVVKAGMSRDDVQKALGTILHLSSAANGATMYEIDWFAGRLFINFADGKVTDFNFIAR